MAAISSFAQLLISAQSAPDPQTRASSEQIIQSLTQTQPAQFLYDLSSELSNEQSSKLARQIAGLTLKNTILNVKQEAFLDRLWISLPPDSKAQIRNNTLCTLATQDRDVRLAAAQAVACIAKLDIPLGEWPDILGILINNATHQDLNVKMISLTTLGYICEELPSSCITKVTADQILTAICANFSDENCKDDLKIIAIQALRNSLPFTHENFQKANEREYIINILCDLCTNPNLNIRISALQVLCDIAGLYYEYLQTNLMQLGTVTYSTIRQDDPRAAVLGVEFWNVIADIENLKIENNFPVLGFINTAADTLIPILLEKIAIFEDDDDEWNLHKAGSTTIGAVSQIIGDSVVDKVASYILSHIESPNWKERESAVLVFGSILDGPGHQPISRLMQNILGNLLQLLKDDVKSVKKTTAWALSKLCEFHSLCILNDPSFLQIVHELLEALKSHPLIASHCCWAVINLAEKLEGYNVFTKDHVDAMINAFLIAANRPDAIGHDYNLQISSFSAINTIIEKSGKDSVKLIESKIPHFIIMLKKTLHLGNTEHLQAYLCSALQTCFGRSSTGAVSDADAREFMDTILQIFKVRGTVIEEGIQAIGALAQNIETRFEPFVQPFHQYLLWALSNQEISSICKAATMSVGDLARSLGQRLSPYIHDIIPILLRNLESNIVSTDVKIMSIEAMGDLASNTRGIFSHYLNQVLQYIEGAANLSVKEFQDDNPDLKEYLLQLREAIIEFYVGLIQGLHETNQTDSILLKIPNIIQYTLICVNQKHTPSYAVHSAALGLLGDIANAYRKKVAEHLKNPNVFGYLQMHKEKGDPRLKEMAEYSLGQISAI
ncbi:unnamed protein product [Blepharisma stoltei]|uniref:Importin N-terminal domain-containing protein n=1 Tax=Blepharisma stoltei TaxID=1481888 RepID=A0AAU9JAW7_9CILI|nr:unnamed protein product [Blepharisma stoltei]